MTGDRSSWAGRRVLVTGHTGFKGSWLSIWLASLGAEVVGLSDAVPSDPALYDQVDVASSLLEDHRVDVRDRDAVARVVQATEPSIVFHLAAQSLVRRSYDLPHETFDVNVMGTSNVLETAAAQASTEAVIVVTSDKCYENDGSGRAYRETDPLGGRDPYSASKAAAELLTRSYRESLVRDGRPALATVRAGNVIGGGDWARDRLIPDLVRAAGGSDREVTLRNPDARRPWQHVLDCLGGYLLLVERMLAGDVDGGAWNFGPNVHASAPVSEVVERFVAALGIDLSVRVERDEGRPEEPRLGLDTQKARERLGWSPKLDLHTALEMTAAWYQAFLAGEDLRSLTREHVTRFEAMR